MSRLLKGSRRFLLGVAFVGVLTGTGGFMGAVGGLMLVLMSQVVLDWNAGLIELMPASTGLGALTALSFGVFLLARHTPVISWQTRLRLATLHESKGEQVSS